MIRSSYFFIDSIDIEIFLRFHRCTIVRIWFKDTLEIQDRAMLVFSLVEMSYIWLKSVLTSSGFNCCNTCAWWIIITIIRIQMNIASSRRPFIRCLEFITILENEQTSRRREEKNAYEMIGRWTTSRFGWIEVTIHRGRSSL